MACAPSKWFTLAARPPSEMPFIAMLGERTKVKNCASAVPMHTHAPREGNKISRKISGEHLGQVVCEIIVPV